MIAQVVVDIKNKAVDRTFDYEIPTEFTNIIRPGVRVLVPFGPRQLAGFVLSTSQTSDYSKKLRPITKIMDLVPILDEELLHLGKTLARDTGATMIATFDAMIPAAMKTKYKKKYVRHDMTPHPELDALFAGADQLDEAVVTPSMRKLLQQAIDDFAVEIIYEASATLGKKTKRYVRFLKPPVSEESLKRSKKQLELYQWLKQTALPVAKDVVPFSDAVLKGLLEKEVIEYVDVEVYRDPFAASEMPQAKQIQLNEYQQQAVDIINDTKEGVILLHGVTGSGKTEVYLEAIQHALDTNKKSLVLIPEIALTTQLTSRFKARFGTAIAVLHSGLSVGERYDEWRKIKAGLVSVVIGARSAVFAPLSNIGLIIIDEEHESTYKQDEMPRYHAIEVAKMRAAYHHCPVVLGSATPSLESYARAKKGVYTLVELPGKAVAAASVPKVVLTDLNEEVLGRNQTVMSTKLEAAIDEQLQCGNQVILLLNRRGYANFMQCRDCHEVVSCPHCDVTLTYHKFQDLLKCHYCGFTAPTVSCCVKCESDQLRFFGSGTQKIEEFLAERWPHAGVIRMDNDTTRKKGDHARLIKAFEKREAQILIGTQMVAKGLDFPGVMLVGVIDSDTMLHFPDYKATERTFQILMQVSGRAGRHAQGAQVYIETYSPEHYVMQHVKNQDYVAFYEEEMKFRRSFRYSPYFFHAKILLTSLDGDFLYDISSQMAQFLQTHLAAQCVVIGPTIPGVARVNDRYRMHFILKYKQAPTLLETMRQMMEQFAQPNVSIAVDYFPTHLA